MMLLTQEIRDKLLANGKASADSEGGIDHAPVVNLFTPDAGATWLLSELDPENPDIAFGLCDLGLGCPELGYVSISEIESVRGRLRLPPERDLGFSSITPLGEWADVTRQKDAIAGAEPVIKERERSAS